MRSILEAAASRFLPEGKKPPLRPRSFGEFTGILEREGIPSVTFVLFAGGVEQERLGPDLQRVLMQYGITCDAETDKGRGIHFNTVLSQWDTQLHNSPDPKFELENSRNGWRLILTALRMQQALRERIPNMHVRMQNGEEKAMNELKLRTIKKEAPKKGLTAWEFA